MKTNKKEIENGSVDELVKQALRDDLPPDVEARMIEQFKRPGKDFITSRSARPIRALGFRSVLFRTERRRRITWAWGREALAMGAVGLVVSGGFLHLSSRSGGIAESLSSMSALVSVSSEVGRVEAMSCTIDMLSEGGAVEYSVDWLPSRAARVDVRRAGAILKTLWVLDGRTIVADRENQTLREQGGLGELDDPLFKPVTGFLSPALLSDRIYSRWRFMSQGRVAEGDVFRFMNHENGVIWEMALNSEAGLPSQVRKYRPGIPGGKDVGGLLMEVRFRWNEPVPPDSMVPRLERKSPAA